MQVGTIVTEDDNNNLRNLDRSSVLSNKNVGERGEVFVQTLQPTVISCNRDNNQTIKSNTTKLAPIFKNSEIYRFEPVKQRDGTSVVSPVTKRDF